MLELRLISAAPLLCVLACTASYPNELGEPSELAVADDLDAASLARPLRAPRPSASATGEGAVPRGNLIGHGSSTGPPGYSGSRGFENFGGRGIRVPTVRQARPEVVGELHKDRVRQGVRPHIGEVRGCYNKVLARDPNAKGRVAIAFEIDGTGKVRTASVHESTMKDPNCGECIAAAMRGWRFPKPRTGTVSVVYPFVLEPG